MLLNAHRQLVRVPQEDVPDLALMRRPHMQAQSI
jgi:hypothetical protein